MLKRFRLNLIYSRLKRKKFRFKDFILLNGRQSRRFPHQIFDILDELKIKSRKVCLNFSLYLHGGLAV